MSNKSIGTRIVILLSYTMTMMLTSVAMPIMGNIGESFPDTGAWVPMVMSIWSLTIIPAMLIAGFLSKVVSKKWIIVVGTALYCIGGLVPAFSGSIEVIVVMRGLSGFGVGLVFPLVPAIISQIYKGDDVGKMVGWGYAAGGIFSSVASVAVGYIALVDWHFAFYLTVIYVAVLFMQIIWLPAVPPEKQDEEIVKSAEKPKLNWLSWVYIIICGVWMILAMVYIMQTSAFILEENIGNSVEAGWASTITNIASFLISFVFGWLMKGLKRWTFIVGVAATSLMFFFMSIATSFIWIVISSIFMGIALGMTLAYLIASLPKVLPQGAVTLATSYTSTSMYIGQFLSAYFITFLIAFSGSSKTAFTIAAILAAVMLVISIIFIVSTKSKYNELLVKYDTPAES